MKEIFEGKYQAITQFDRHELGAAYYALDNETGVCVILQELYVGGDENDPSIRNILSTAKLVTALKHEHIVQLREVFEKQGRAYLVSEYVEGKTLADHIKLQKIISPAHALRVVEQVASALAYAHSYGVIHRAITPKAILVTDNGLVKLGNFGVTVAGVRPASFVLEKMASSLPYMPPEQVKGELTDERSDLYSLGMVFYEMLTGKTLFDDDTPAEILRKLTHPELAPAPRFPSTVPANVQELVKQLIYPDPNRRLAEESSLIRSVQTAVIARPVTAPTTSPATQESASPVTESPNTGPKSTMLVPVTRAAVKKRLFALPRLNRSAALALAILICGTTLAYFVPLKQYYGDTSLSLSKMTQGWFSGWELDQVDLPTLQQSVAELSDSANKKLSGDQATEAKHYALPIYTQALITMDTGNFNYLGARNALTEDSMQAAKRYFKDAHIAYTDALTLFERAVAVATDHQDLVHSQERAAQARQKAESVAAKTHATENFEEALSRQSNAVQLAKQTFELFALGESDKALAVKARAIEDFDSSDALFERAYDQSVDLNLLTEISDNQNTLRRLQQRIIQVRRNAERVDAPRYAAALYNEAQLKNNELLSYTKDISELLKDKKYRAANDVLVAAVESGKLAINKYKLAKSSAEESRMLGVLKLRQRVYDTLVIATQVEANQLAKDSFDQAQILIHRSDNAILEADQYQETSQYLKARSSIDEAQEALSSANVQLRKSIRLSLQQRPRYSSRLAKTVDLDMLLSGRDDASPVKLESLNSKDAKIVERLLADFETAYEKKDLPKLKSLSVMSENRSRSIEQMFNELDAIDVSIRDLSLQGNTAYAVVTIDKLVNAKGEMIEPPDQWPTSSHITIKKNGGNWDKINW